MITVRKLIDMIREYIDLDYSHYIASSITLPLEGEGGYHYSSMWDDDIRNEIYIDLGEGLSTIKNGHIKTVHCTIPKEFITPEIEKYRDWRDPVMYKFWLPEREFNALIKQHPINVPKMIEIAQIHHMIH